MSPEEAASRAAEAAAREALLEWIRARTEDYPPHGLISDLAMAAWREGVRSWAELYEVGEYRPMKMTTTPYGAESRTT